METPPKKVILIIESNARNAELLIEFLGDQGYECISVSDVSKLTLALNPVHPIHLAMVDLTGYDPSIWAACEEIRQRGIQLLVISPKQSITIQQESIKHGASGVLTKPLVMRELSSLINTMING